MEKIGRDRQSYHRVELDMDKLFSNLKCFIIELKIELDHVLEKELHSELFNGFYDENRVELENWSFFELDHILKEK